MEAIQAIDEREKGTQIPISIATALAIESSLGIMPEHETPDAPILKAGALYINLRTLFRNLMGSIDKEQRGVISPEDLSFAMINEMQAIETAIIKGSNGHCETVFYVCSYLGVPRRYPYATLKENKTKTSAQEIAWLTEEHALKALLEFGGSQDIRLYDLDFDQDERNVFIITHYPIDLLNRYRFRALSLLESHTGAIKPPVQWYTKLTNGKELSHIPFDRMTLQVFGDGVTFLGQGIKTKRQLQELGAAKKWTSVTTKDLMASHIKQLKDPTFEGAILKLY